MAYTNSSLVSYTRLSPNCTKPRDHAIDTLSVHCMAGNLSVETCGSLFANSSRQASSNYGIGSDGRIAMYVEEQNRSWCTSNRANDMRAITIEVANINTTDYAISDAAYKSLINLCADICKRNNIKKLIWSTDKNTRVNHLNSSNMTVHRDYAAKSCPADWLYSHMGEIAGDVNKLMNGIVDTKPEVDENKSEEAMMYQFLRDKKESNIVIFSLMGNIFAESGIRANNLQNSYENKLKMSDDQYTKAVDNGTYTNFIKDSAGYGYAQWTFWSRKQELYNYAKKCSKSIGDPAMQRDFLWYELTTTYKGMMDELRKCTTLRAASDIVLTKFEKPADQSEAVKARRAEYAQMLYDKYNEYEEVKFPYMVRILCDLNIRKEPDPNKDNIVNTIKDNGVYTIVEEQLVGTKVWGKLKSGAGWIRLTDYTQKV